MVGELIKPYLQEMVNAGASDLFLTFGYPPCLRVESRLKATEKPALTGEEIDKVIEDLLSEDQLGEFKSTLELNIAFSMGEEGRFRINIFRQNNHAGLVARLIKSRIPTFEELGLPEIYSKFIMEKRGLFLMVGATGSGKSTSLASMLDYRNSNGSGHIITIEDPIEFLHFPKGCIFTQREVGIDTYSYGMALKNALRQSPDVILIGEIRDRETMENAILFCETGHLVIATLHSNNANQAIERIINLFPEELRRQILSTLSQNLNAIISQRLVEDVYGNRSVAYEILINEGLSRLLIEEGKLKEIKDLMEKSRDRGMITFDQCLFDMINQKKITEEVALREADNPSNLRLRIKQATGASTSSKANIINDF